MANSRSNIELTYGRLDHERYYDSLFKYSGASLVDHFKNLGGSFSYVVSTQESDWLTKRGVQLHPSAVLVHSHPVSKMIENHMLLCVAGPIMSRFEDWTIMSLRKSKFLQLAPVVQKGLHCDESPSDLVTQRFQIINRILGAKDVCRYEGYESSGHLSYTNLKRNFSSDFSEYPKGNSVFLHDELHFWAVQDMRNFLRQCSPKIVVATVVYPVEYLNGYEHSLNPEAYLFEVHKCADDLSFGRSKKILFLPDGVRSQAYLQPADLSWLFRASGFEVINDDGSASFYSCCCIQTIGAHHIFVFEKDGAQDVALRTFGENDAADVSEFAGIVGLKVPDCYISYSTMVDIVNYEYSLKKMSVESAVTKFRLKKIQRGSMVEEMFFLREVVRLLSDLQPHPGSFQRFGDMLLKGLSGGLYDRQMERFNLSEAVLSLKKIEISIETSLNAEAGGWISGPRFYKAHSAFKKIVGFCQKIRAVYKGRYIVHAAPDLILSSLRKFYSKECGDKLEEGIAILYDKFDSVNGIFFLSPTFLLARDSGLPPATDHLMIEWYPIPSLHTDDEEEDDAADQSNGGGSITDFSSSDDEDEDRFDGASGTVVLNEVADVNVANDDVIFAEESHFEAEPPNAASSAFETGPRSVEDIETASCGSSSKSECFIPSFRRNRGDIGSKRPAVNVNKKIYERIKATCEGFSEVSIRVLRANSQKALSNLIEGEVGVISDKFKNSHRSFPNESKLYHEDFEVEALGFFGFAGSGKTRGIMDLIKSIQYERQVLIVSPSRLLRDSMSGELRSSEVGRKSKVSCCTYEIALMKDLGFYDLIFLDEIYSYFPGYLSLLVSLRAAASTRSCTFVIAGDQLQSRFYDRKKGSDFNIDFEEFKCHPELRYNNKSYRCGKWIEFFFDGVIGNEEISSNLGSLVSIDDANLDSYEVILCPSSKRVIELSKVITNGRVTVMTMKQSQGLTFDSGAVLLTKDIFKVGIEIVMVALTRFKSCPDFIFDYGIREVLEDSDFEAWNLLRPILKANSVKNDLQSMLGNRVKILSGVNLGSCDSRDNNSWLQDYIEYGEIPELNGQLTYVDITSRLSKMSASRTRWSESFFFSSSGFEYGHDKIQYASNGWPSWISDIAKQLNLDVNSCLVNVYKKFAEIPFHADDEKVYDLDEMEVTCVSIGSCILKVKLNEKIASVRLDNNKIYTMKRGAQKSIKHKVTSLDRRVSLTFRKQNFYPSGGRIIEDKTTSRMFRRNECMFKAMIESMNVDLLELARARSEETVSKVIVKSYDLDIRLNLGAVDSLLNLVNLGCYLYNDGNLIILGNEDFIVRKTKLIATSGDHAWCTSLHINCVEGKFSERERIISHGESDYSIQMKLDLQILCDVYIKFNNIFDDNIQVFVNSDVVCRFSNVKKIGRLDDCLSLKEDFPFSWLLDIWMSPNRPYAIILKENCMRKDFLAAVHFSHLIGIKFQCEVIIYASTTAIRDLMRESLKDEVLGTTEEKLQGDIFLQSNLDISDESILDIEELDVDNVPKEVFSNDYVSGCFEILKGNHVDKLRENDEREAVVKVGNVTLATEQFKMHAGRDSWCFPGDDQMNFEMIYPRHNSDDGATYIWAIRKRLMFSNFSTEYSKFRAAYQRGAILKKALDEVIDFGGDFDQGLFEVAKKEFEKCRYVGKSKEVLENNAGRSDPGWDDFTIRSFMKSQLCTKNDNRYIDAKAGQTIACFAHSVLLRFGPYAKYIEMKLNERLPKKWYIHSGKNFDDLNDFVIANYKGPLCVESDFSAFDASQDADMLNFEVLIMKQMGIPMDIIEDYVFLKCRLGSNLGNLAIMRFTGEFSTFLFNSLVNMAYTSCRYKVSTETPILFAGDDMCILENVPERTDFTEYLDSLKLKAKVRRCFDPTFCGWRLTECGIYKHHWLVAERLLIAKELNKLDLCCESYFIEFEYALRLPDPIMLFTSEEIIYFSLLIEVFDGLSYSMRGKAKEMYMQHRANEPRNFHSTILSLGHLILPEVLRALSMRAARKTLESLAFHFEYDWSKGEVIPGWIEMIDEYEFNLKMMRKCGHVSEADKRMMNLKNRFKSHMDIVYDCESINSLSKSKLGVPSNGGVDEKITRVNETRSTKLDVGRFDVGENQQDYVATNSSGKEVIETSLGGKTPLTCSIEQMYLKDCSTGQDSSVKGKGAEQFKSVSSTSASHDRRKTKVDSLKASGKLPEVEVLKSLRYSIKGMVPVVYAENKICKRKVANALTFHFDSKSMEEVLIKMRNMNSDLAELPRIKGNGSFRIWSRKIEPENYKSVETICNRGPTKFGISKILFNSEAVSIRGGFEENELKKYMFNLTILRRDGNVQMILDKGDTYYSMDVINLVLKGEFRFISD